MATESQNGYGLNRLEEMVNLFLKSTTRNMEARGFGLPPVGYLDPRVYFCRDRLGVVNQPRFYLTWPREQHATLFYVLWNNYHWASRGGEETLILRTRNLRMDSIGDRAETRYILRDSQNLRQDAFVDFFQAWERVMGGLGRRGLAAA